MVSDTGCAPQLTRATTTPRQKYDAYLADGTIFPDAAQARVVDALDALHARLVARHGRPKPLWQRLKGAWGSTEPPEPGLYLWGDVGRGKTFLADLFYDCLPFDARMRLHFHRFMRGVHADLTRLAGTENPLDTVADSLASRTRVLCFDEFFVSDIGDAMILSELLRGLFERGVTLVATSNVAPEHLYENGLQRRRFLPAIALIQRHTQVLSVDGAVDYRLRVLERAEIYYHREAPTGGTGAISDSVDRGAERALKAAFEALVPDPDGVLADQSLEIEGRSIDCRRCGDDVAWFDFRAICEGPRSQNDYIELARLYHAVLISDVPVFTTRNEDAARRFISLVDEFYDRNVKLMLSAAAPIDSLYQGERLAFEFQRTRSRLLEMQSHDYLARTHRA